MNSIEVILSQVGLDHIKHPTEKESKTLSKKEKNFCRKHKEMPIPATFVKKFRYRVRHWFCVHADHQVFM